MESLSLKDQKGTALVVALLMLIVLTLIGVASVSSSFFEMKISGNSRVGQAAYYAAKGGAEVGINQLPGTVPYSGNIGNETYRSGKMVNSSAQPVLSLGLMARQGYESTWEFRRYQVNATGQSSDARKEIEVQISMGPYVAGTQYNN
ncbi:MAG: pilus assembly PilX family protein [Thermodesulfobacteriota bacterium]